SDRDNKLAGRCRTSAARDGLDALDGIYALQRVANLVRGAGPNQARDFLAVPQEHQRRPKPDAERATQGESAGVGDLDMAHSRVIGERHGQSWLCRTAIAAPWRPELDHHGPCQQVDLGPRRLDRHIRVAHRHRRRTLLSGIKDEGPREYSETPNTATS